MNAVNAHSLKRGLAGVLLGLGLPALAGCGDFHRLALLWEEPPAPLVLHRRRRQLSGAPGRQRG